MLPAGPFALFKCASASALLLKYVRAELLQLRAHYDKVIAPKVHVGNLILPVEAVRERYRVVCPGDEASAPPDEFN